MPRDLGRWSEELEQDVMDLVSAHLRVAVCQQRLAGKIDKLPEKFENSVMVASQLGLAVEQAVLAEAAARGLYTPSRLSATLPHLVATCLDKPVEEPAPEVSIVVGAPEPAPDSPQRDPVRVAQVRSLVRLVRPPVDAPEPAPASVPPVAGPMMKWQDGRFMPRMNGTSNDS